MHLGALERVSVCEKSECAAYGERVTTGGGGVGGVEDGGGGVTEVSGALQGSSGGGAGGDQCRTITLTP